MKTILVVEDESPLRAAYSSRLASAGYSVVVAKNGLEGLEQAEEHSPDVILLDLFMPKMDGQTMLAKLRAEDWGKDIPVIVATNSAEAEDVLATLKGNVQAHFIKAETDFNTVIAAVESAIASSKQN